MEMREVLYGFAHMLRGAVRGIVVHNQNVQIVRWDGVRLREYSGENSRNVLGFIKSWEDDASDWSCHFSNCGPERLFGATYPL